MLSAIPCVESQLQSHMRISLNPGLTANQLRVSEVLAKHGQSEMARRASEALHNQLRAKLTTLGAVTQPSTSLR